MNLEPGIAIETVMPPPPPTPAQLQAMAKAPAIPIVDGRIAPRDTEDIWWLAKRALETGLVPKDFRPKNDSPEELRAAQSRTFIAMNTAHHLGFDVFMGIHKIAVINGRPALWGEALIALGWKAGMSGFHQWFEDSAGNRLRAGQIAPAYAAKDILAYCKASRGDSTLDNSFSFQQAQVAGLIGKDTWKSFPHRMMMWKPTGWVLKSLFADRLMGLELAEDIIDIPADSVRDVTPAPRGNSARMATMIERIEQPKPVVVDPIAADDSDLPTIHDLEAERILAGGDETPEFPGFSNDPNI